MRRMRENRLKSLKDFNHNKTSELLISIPQRKVYGGIVEMEIRISLEIKDEVSPQLLEFVKSVLDREMLNHWNVHIWSCRREGLCTDTEIIFGPCEAEIKTKLLFLHEVAHALRSHIDLEDSYWHREGWDGEYGRLCREHLGIVASEYKELKGLFV